MLALLRQSICEGSGLRGGLGVWRDKMEESQTVYLMRASCGPGTWNLTGRKEEGKGILEAVYLGTVTRTQFKEEKSLQP